MIIYSTVALHSLRVDSFNAISKIPLCHLTVSSAPKLWVISFNSVWFWLWLNDEVLYLEFLCDPRFWHIRSSFMCSWRKLHHAKWNSLIAEAKYNESWKLALPPTLDPNSSTASNETFNHFEMIVSCRRRTLLQFLWWDELNIYRPTVASVALRGHNFSEKVCFGRKTRANDVKFTLLTQRFMVFSGASMNCITHL